MKTHQAPTLPTRENTTESLTVDSALCNGSCVRASLTESGLHIYKMIINYLQKNISLYWL